METLRLKVTHPKPTTLEREIAVSASLQCVLFFSSSSSEWATAEDSISSVVSDNKNKHLNQRSAESKLMGGEIRTLDKSVNWVKCSAMLPVMGLKVF